MIYVWSKNIDELFALIFNNSYTYRSFLLKLATSKITGHSIEITFKL